MTLEESFASTYHAEMRYGFDPVGHAQTWLERWDVTVPENLAHEAEGRRPKLSYLARLRSFESVEGQRPGTSLGWDFAVAKAVRSHHQTVIHGSWSGSCRINSLELQGCGTVAART